MNDAPAGVVLAAGAGTRLGGPKALLRIDGELLVERAARMLRAGGCAPVIVVLGAQADAVRASAELDDVVVVVNPAWESGMGWSLRSGLDSAAAFSAPAAVVALVDQPGITPAVVRRLIALWQAGAEAVVATYGGQPRNPVLLDAAVWPDVAARATGDVGARAWLRANPDRVTAVPCDDLADADDIDTPHDLEQHLSPTTPENLMDLQNAFTVPLPVEEAWPVLLDVERVAPCMPGATLLTHDGDEFTGTVKVKIGPVQMTYKGSAKFVETDGTARRAVIEASGKDTRGGGTAAATVTLHAKADGDATRVEVTTDLNITGRPAQFGRGVLAEVSGKLVNQFAGSLAKEMARTDAPPATSAPQAAAGPDAAPGEPDAASEAAAEAKDAAAPLSTSNGTEVTGGPANSASPGPTAPAPPHQSAEAIDLLSVAGGSVVKRVAPLVGFIALVLLLVWRRRRRA